MRRQGLVNRNNATIAVAQGLLIDLQPQHLTSCCALKRPETPMKWALLRCCGSKRVLDGVRVCVAVGGSRWVRHLKPTKQKHAESNIVGNRANRPFFDPASHGTAGLLSRPSMARISGRRGIRIDAARFATEKPDPHRPAASSHLRCQADGTWMRFPGPKPPSAMARRLARQTQQTSHQLPARRSA